MPKVVDKLGYKLVKSHKFSSGYIVLCQMELETTYLVALTTEDYFVESTVVYSLDIARKLYNQMKQIYMNKNN